MSPRDFDRSRRRALKTLAGGAAVAGTLGFPAIVRAQQDTLKFGHLTPRTGFLGQLGDYGFKAASMAVDELNAGGGLLGRKIELVAEDSVNPQVAVTKAQRLVERDKVLCLIGEINSASALAIGEQVARYNIPFFHTRPHSAAPRGNN